MFKTVEMQRIELVPSKWGREKKYLLHTLGKPWVNKHVYTNADTVIGACFLAGNLGYPNVVEYRPGNV